MTALGRLGWSVAMLAIVGLLAAQLAVPAVGRAAPLACAGDCGGDRVVTVDELLIMVNVALGRRPVGACAAGDGNGDLAITIEEIIAAVDASLHGCGSGPTPTVQPCAPTPAATCAAACQLTGCCIQDGAVQCFNPAIQCTPSARATCAPGWYGYTTCGNQGQYGDACQLPSTAAVTGTPTQTPPALSTPTATVTGQPTATATTTLVAAKPSTTATSTAATPTVTPGPSGHDLYESLGIGADWGPHWSASASAIDPRDNQDDSAFPVEVCLLATAGFQSIRMYGENVETWISVLKAVDAYNTGALVCVQNQQGPPAQPLSVVYQVAICGPDPRSLEWNGAYASIDAVRCYEPGMAVDAETPFTQSLDAEVLKLRQVLRYAGGEFAKHVKLVLVGNEILFSRGTCGDGTTACTDDGDCSDGSCSIAHYCSDTLSAVSPAQATTCTAEPDCTSAGKGSCTDVTNLAPLHYAFDRVANVLEESLGPMATQPAISISLQVDVMVAPAPGVSPPSDAPLLWSRQQLAAALPSQVVAVNTYPDQWGLVISGQMPTCAAQSYPSCIDATNAVSGPLLSQCMADADAYTDPVTGFVAHRIDTYYQLLTRYYPNYRVVIAETGWHTAGTCLGYNDCVASPRYSPAAAQTYYEDLYQYVQEKRIPLLVFELFDQKTKVCSVASGTTMGEANYGVFTNYCQLKGGLQELLPPAANLPGFELLLGSGGQSGTSCENQSLLTITGAGQTGVCAADPTTPCLSSANCTTGNCVWGYCSSLSNQGCNPDDPNNPPGCGTCVRAGNCYDTTPPAGYFEATPNGLSCSSDASCASATCPFGTCGCFSAMAPATVSAGNIGGPGMVVQYSNGTFQFEKALGPLALVQPAGDGTFIAQPLWNNIVVGQSWTVNLLPPTTPSGTPAPCSNTVMGITPGATPGTTPATTPGVTPNIVWQSPWSCAYPPPPAPATPNTMIITESTSLSVPRTFFEPIPRWSAQPSPTETPTPMS